MNEQTQLDVILQLKDELSGKITGVNSHLSKMGDIGNNLQGTFSRIGSRFSSEFGLITSAAKMATAGVGLLAGGVVAMGVASINAAADMETMRVALKTAMGGDESAAGKAFDTITKFAAKTPYQMGEVMNSFIKLKNMGLDPSEKALTSYGDTASAMGKGLNQMIEAVADAATGEFERLKEFGIRSSSEGNRVKFTFKGVTTEVGKNSKEIEDYLIKLGETNFAGGMDEQSKTFSGLMSTMKDNVSMTLASIATDSGMLDVLKNAIASVSTFVEQNKGAMIDWAKNAIAVVQEKIKAWIEQMGGPEGIKQKLIDFKNTIVNDVIPMVESMIKKVASITKSIWDHREAILWAILAWEVLKVALSIGDVIKATIKSIELLSVAMGLKGATGTANGLSTALARLPLMITISVVLAGFAYAMQQIATLNEAINNVNKKREDYEKATASAAEKLKNTAKGSDEHNDALEELKKISEDSKNLSKEISETTQSSWLLRTFDNIMTTMEKNAATSKKNWEDSFAYAKGGVVYASNGFASRGTDTIPAMLTPGEMVLNASQQSNLFDRLNSQDKKIEINISGDNYFSNGEDSEKLINKIMIALSREQERAEFGM